MLDAGEELRGVVAKLTCCPPQRRIRNWPQGSPYSRNVMFRDSANIEVLILILGAGNRAAHKTVISIYLDIILEWEKQANQHVRLT